MSNGQKIEAHKVTKPIQLLAAWLVGLILIDAMLLGGSLQQGVDSWERGALVIAAIVNVPLFLGAMFILQTKFRPELQDDSHYSAYLSKKTSEVVTIQHRHAELGARLEVLETEYLRRSSSDPRIGENPSDVAACEEKSLDWSMWRVALNDNLPRFTEIREALRDARIPLALVFGDAHEKDPEIPSNWVVSINRAMPFGHKLALIKLLAPFELDGFQYWTPIRDADETEDVYIGSYGVSSYTPFGEGLNLLLMKDVEQVDLDQFRKKFRILPEPLATATDQA